MRQYQQSTIKNQNYIIIRQAVSQAMCLTTCRRGIMSQEEGHWHDVWNRVIQQHGTNLNQHQAKQVPKPSKKFNNNQLKN